MDTKLKRFDISWITKIICFLLAVMFIAIGVTKTLHTVIDVSIYCDENSVNSSYFENILHQGKSFNLEESDMFAHEYRNFIDNAGLKAFVYKNGSKQAYDDYVKKYNTIVKASLDTEINNMFLSVAEDWDEQMILFDYVDEGKIELKKISNATGAESKANIMYYNGETYLNYCSDEDEYDEDDEDYEVTEYEDVTLPAPLYSTTHVTEAERASIPQNIIDMAKDYSAVIFVNYENYYGYYGVTANRDEFTLNVFDDYFNYGYYPAAHYNFFGYTAFGSLMTYEEFKGGYESTVKELSEYKNMYYAISDGSSIYTNSAEAQKLKKVNDVKKMFLSYPWSYTVDTKNSADYEYGALLRDMQVNTFAKISTFDSYKNSNYNVWQAIKSIFNEDYVIMIAFDSKMPNEDVFSNIEEKYINIYGEIFRTFVVDVICLAGFIICLVILIIKSGRHRNDDELHMRSTDKIFTLLRIAVNVGLITSIVALGIWIVDTVLTYGYRYSYMYTSIAILSILAAALLIDVILYITRHMKNHTLLKNIFIVWLILKLKQKRAEKRAERKAKREERRAKLAARPAVFRDIFNDVLRKIVLYVAFPNAVAGLIAFYFACYDEWGFAIFFSFMLVIYDVLVLVYLLKYAYSLRKVLYTLEQVRQGNYDIKVDTDRMPTTVKAYADAINSIGEGLKVAVDNAVKEEKTRTELITNVSHDLKTPLTSIITYVDLLSRCNIENEDARGYIEVLGEKSSRLKRLIEDLVEASKASTDNIKVNLVSFSLNELTMQIAGEYEDEFETRGLTLLVDGLETNLTVLADSKMSYRILENLMNNIRKYAMPGTRVYLNLSKENGKAVLVLKNISENQLNIPASELMQRFVRGDASRSTQGSGLGLSIAENFSRLQGGKLSIDIIGDLFTARVEFVISDNIEQ